MESLLAWTEERQGVAEMGPRAPGRSEAESESKVTNLQGFCPPGPARVAVCSLSLEESDGSFAPQTTPEGCAGSSSPPPVAPSREMSQSLQADKPCAGLLRGNDIRE